MTFTGSYNIDVHDYTVRLKAAQRFLKDGDKVLIIYKPLYIIISYDCF